MPQCLSNRNPLDVPCRDGGEVCVGLVASDGHTAAACPACPSCLQPARAREQREHTALSQRGVGSDPGVLEVAQTRAGGMRVLSLMCCHRSPGADAVPTGTRATRAGALEWLL